MTTDDNSLPNIQHEKFHVPNIKPFSTLSSLHKPRILLLYGSLRKRSYSRLVIEESARLLTNTGAGLKFLTLQYFPK